MQKSGEDDISTVVDDSIGKVHKSKGDATSVGLWTENKTWRRGPQVHEGLVELQLTAYIAYSCADIREIERVA